MISNLLRFGQDLAGPHRHDPLLAAVCDSDHIERIEVRREETSRSRAVPVTTTAPATSGT